MAISDRIISRDEAAGTDDADRSDRSPLVVAAPRAIAGVVSLNVRDGVPML
ncbi:hypothetical protein ACQR16_24150 [Bradyrhizobium oligotrophicum]|uniref:hypothetical protein n=1 Tax=Bradyrhizobium oligotrophicum TaxID=44255 RepID=UPI003EBC4BF4